jgi:hypothetical protein
MAKFRESSRDVTVVDERAQPRYASSVILIWLDVVRDEYGIECALKRRSYASAIYGSDRVVKIKQVLPARDADPSDSREVEHPEPTERKV